MGARKGNWLVRIGRFAVFAAIATATAAYLHLSLPNVADRDALYHFRHAVVYAQDGILTGEFAWVTCSVVSRWAADIWYGFHLLLVPFTFNEDPVRGVKLAGAADLAALLILFHLALRRSRIRWPSLWPFLLISFSPFLLYRLLMTRPHVISMGLAACLLAFACSGGLWGVGLASFALTFIHMGLFWVVPLVIAMVTLVKRRTEGAFEWRVPAAAAGGMILGWLLRPNPFGAAKLVYVQIVQWAIEKQKGVPLLFGGSLMSGRDSFDRAPGDSIAHFAPCLLLWTAALLVFLAALNHDAKLGPKQRTLMWSSLCLSGLLLLVAIQFSLRANDLFSTFAVMMIASVFTFIARPGAASDTGYSDRKHLTIVATLGALLMAFIFWRALDEHTAKMPGLGYSPHRMEAAAQWLRDNSRRGDIVFHAHWDLFPDLFFWNTHNRYIGGMDPIFQYAYDQDLYWKAHHLYSGRFGSYTCGTPHCSPLAGEGTFTVLRRDFNASYLVLEEQRHAALFAHASQDERFALGFDKDGIAVFRLAGQSRGD
jgi:hypothetical protein